MNRYRLSIRRLNVKNVPISLIFFATFINGILIWKKPYYSNSAFVEPPAIIDELNSEPLFPMSPKASEPSANCDRVLLYATDYLNPVGLVAQLNTFLRAVLIAIVEDRRLVFLHSNDQSMFGCPGVVQNKKNHSSADDEQPTISYPGGLGHVLDVSPLSHQCPPPPCHRLPKWNRLAYRVIQKKNMNAHITCRRRRPDRDNNNNHTNSTSVLLLGGFPLRQYFRDQIQPKLDKADNLQDWGKRLGIHSVEEIQSLQKDANSRDETSTQRSSYYRNRIMSLVKPFVQFQPWIRKDVKELVDNYYNASAAGGKVRFQEMIGIHIRRGDKLKVESRQWVEDYWRRQGYSKEDMPVNYVPLVAYLQKIPASSSMIRDVYIATDDPVTIQKEIQELPDRSHWRFHFNPLATSGHLNTLENCRDKYQHTIAAIFDLMVLESCKLFVGEYNSNWGRWIRYRREGEVRVVFGPSDVSWPR